LLDKHIALVVKTEQKKAELMEAHAVELAEVKEYLEREMQDCKDYHLNIQRHLRGLHEVVASSLGEVKARSLPFLAQNVKVEELIDWVSGVVKAVPDTMLQVNVNFVVLAIEGVLNMLNGAGCQELSHLCGLAPSSDASII
jgi:hypothetical protein